VKRFLIFIFLISALFLWFSKNWAEENTVISKKVLILPFEVYSSQEYLYLKEAIPEMLVSRLFVPSKIEIIEMEKVKEAIKNYEKINKEIVKDLGIKFKSNYVIWGSVTVLGDAVSIDAQILDISEEKKPVQFFQEVKNVSEIIPQLGRFARKAKKYIEGKEEDFYQEEPYYAMVPYGIGKEHPERGYYYYAPYLYPTTPRETKPEVTRAKSPYGEPFIEGLTRNLVIDLSTGTIGWAKEEEEEDKNKNQTVSNYPNYPPVYPPQPYYSYSPPPTYYYYSQEEEGFFSKIWSRIWPFGEKEKPAMHPTQVIPMPQTFQNQPVSQSISSSEQKITLPPSSPQIFPQPSKPELKDNPWKWE